MTEGLNAAGKGMEVAEVDNGNFREYFKRLRHRLLIAISVAFIVPLAVLFLYFHIQFNLTLKKGGQLHLQSLAESQRNTIDLFLQERVVNIFSLFHRKELNLNPTQADMDSYIQELREFSDAFIDAGFLDPSGVQIGYSGPFMYLRGVNYSHEKWYRDLMSSKRNYYISDVYPGFRNKPHFTIAVRQPAETGTYVMRATIDPDKLYMFLRTIARGKSVDSALINNEGQYQIVDPDQGTLQGPSDIDPAKMTDLGVTEIRGKGTTLLVAAARLTEVPWFISVRQPLNIAYARMYQTRRIMVGVTIVIVLVIFSAIWLTTSRLLGRAEETEASRRELKSQLFHAAKLVAIGELAAGIAHEINNPLAIILSQCGVIRDMFDPEFGGSLEMQPDTVENLRAEIGVVEESVYRARDITQKLLKSSRKSEPKLVESDANTLLDDVVAGFLEHELMISNIELVRDYDPELPRVRIDPDQMRQVIQNLINNAYDALEGESGTITLSTRHQADEIKISVTDTGKGMPQEVLDRIFLPFFTTKEVGRGTGLGLAISLNIVQSMGGRIDVQSMPGAGSSFIITLPVES